MKTKLILLAGMLAPLALQAEPNNEPKRERAPQGERRLPAEVIAKFDTDGDGKLNAEERKAAMAARRATMEERRKELLEKFDTDKDGKLSPEERRAAMRARFDKDGDGELNEEERKAARQARGARGERRGGPRGEHEGGPRKPRGEGGGQRGRRSE